MLLLLLLVEDDFQSEGNGNRIVWGPITMAAPPPPGLELPLLEKIELHIKVHVLEADFWEGGAVGSLGFDVGTVQALRLPTSRASMKLSPLATITIPDVASRMRYSIPEDASHFCFAYPLLELESKVEDERELNLNFRAVLFLHSGGFVYFNRDREVVRINAVTLAPSRTSTYFTGPHTVSHEAVKTLKERGRMCKVTIDTLQAAGMEEFGWINPLEDLPGVLDVSAVMKLDEQYLNGLADSVPKAVKQLGSHPWPYGALIYNRRQGMEPGELRRDSSSG